jgi:uncharacterized membrane protein YesL
MHFSPTSGLNLARDNGKLIGGFGLVIRVRPTFWRINCSQCVVGNIEAGSMNLLDLIKATVVCGGVAFLFYRYPTLGQILVIATLSLVWLSYARKTVRNVRRRRLA